MRWRSGLTIAAVAGLLLTSPLRADFADGARAYDGGDYATAFKEWHRLAMAGAPAAQVAIASLYRGGIGRRIDLAEAARWYRRAAEQGDPVGQMNLAEMYEKGWGVTRDAVAAFIWYDRAARQGRDWATAQRDRLAKTLSDAEREAVRHPTSELKN